jgi:hypothetical protein
MVCSNHRTEPNLQGETAQFGPLENLRWVILIGYERWGRNYWKRYRARP